MRRITLLLVFWLLVPAGLIAEETRLLRHPDVSDDHIVFAYANDLWIVSRGGGEARRLTTYQGQELHPRFSPDGQRIAFSGQYDGNTDVYVTSIDGGEPLRLTWHPFDDIPTGWTADGSTVVFRTSRTSAPIPNIFKFWQVPVAGGFPAALAPPRVYKGKFSDSGSRLAYQPIEPWDEEWRNYRGGQAGPIWLLDMDDFDLEKIPDEGAQNTDPVWLGEDVYFLSDRDLAVNLYRHATATGVTTQLTHHKVFDAKNLEVGGGVLVYEHGGYIRMFDPASGENSRVEIHVRGDLPWIRPHWEEVGSQIRGFALSPTGKRAVFEARGDIFTVPADKGDVRNMTSSSGVADRAPRWSPDGRSVAWFSDEGGEYGLMIAAQSGVEEPRRIELEDPTFYFTPAWSPDSKYILYTDEGLNLAFVDVKSGEQTRVDTDQFAHPSRTVDPVWSPDSRWIAYAKRMENQYHAVMLYSLDSGEIHQLTDAMSDALSPAWDASGKYLYFLASTNYSLSAGWLDLSSIEHRVRREIYFAVLSDDEVSPLLPESDEEEVADEEGGGDDEGSVAAEDEADEEADIEVKIDFDGIDQRILSLSVPSRNYTSLSAGPEGVIFYSEAVPNQSENTLHRYDLEEREASVFLEAVGRYTLSDDGEKLLYESEDSWFVVDTDAPPESGDGAVETTLRMRVDPRQEWQQIFREAWRYQRDFFYVDNLHGADWNWVWEAYSPWVEHVAHRDDLVHLLDILGGETSIGHWYRRKRGRLPDFSGWRRGDL